MNQHTPQENAAYASALRGTRHVFVRNLTLPAHIGIHPHEQDVAQPISISLDAAVVEDTQDTPQHIAEVVCYEGLVKQITEIVNHRHYDLVETLAEIIADRLTSDSRIARLRIEIGKPHAINAAEMVGIAIERLASAPKKG